jgi:hypothetical protein
MKTAQITVSSSFFLSVAKELPQAFTSVKIALVLRSDPIDFIAQVFVFVNAPMIFLHGPFIDPFH